MFFKKLTLLLFSCVILNLSAGSDFVAVPLDAPMRQVMKIVQLYFAHRVPNGVIFTPVPLENLHITLKEIGDLGDKRKIKRARYVPELANVAARERVFSLHGAFLGSTLKISKNGVVTLRLAPSDKLTHLAREVQKALQHARQLGNLHVLKDRFDFPDNGHITLGYINFNGKNLQQVQNELTRITAAFDPKKMNMAMPKLEVNKFVLYWSNSPDTPRRYDEKGVFYLRR